MEEFIQIYICPVCRSVKLVFGEADSIEKFERTLADRIECNVGECDSNALRAEKICEADGHVHGYIYYENVDNNLIYCSMHASKEGTWRPLHTENLFDSIPDKTNLSRRDLL